MTLVSGEVEAESEDDDDDDDDCKKGSMDEVCDQFTAHCHLAGIYDNAALFL